MSYVTFTADNGTSLKVLLDAASPTIKGGWARWDTIDRPRRRSTVRFAGNDLATQDIAVMLDGWMDDASQEDNVALLESMAQSPDKLQEPPKITLSGHARKRDLTWVITGIDWDDQNAIWELVGGQETLMRLAGVVHLLEYAKDDIITTPGKPTITPDPNKRIKTKQGMSLRQLAQLYYHNPDKYLIILMSNPLLNPDPNAIISAGTSIWIPDIKSRGGFGELIKVPA